MASSLSLFVSPADQSCHLLDGPEAPHADSETCHIRFPVWKRNSRHCQDQCQKPCLEPRTGNETPGFCARPSCDSLPGPGGGLWVIAIPWICGCASPTLSMQVIPAGRQPSTLTSARVSPSSWCSGSGGSARRHRPGKAVRPDAASWCPMRAS